MNAKDGGLERAHDGRNVMRERLRGRIRREW